MEVLVIVAIVAGIIGVRTYDSHKAKKQQLLKAAREEAKSKMLENLSATVFVRESNNNRTNLENHIEQELITRGARVLVSNQKAGMELVKQGDFSPLHIEANFSVIGTLVIRSGVTTQDKDWAESEYDFNLRKAEFESELEEWIRNKRLYTYFSDPRPVLEGRRGTPVQVPALHYQLSFRLIGRDGALLASGTSEEFPRADAASFDDALRLLAEKAISYLDTVDVWNKIVLT
jgi:hypothetical protein